VWKEKKKGTHAGELLTQNLLEDLAHTLLYELLHHGLKVALCQQRLQGEQSALNYGTDEQERKQLTFNESSFRDRSFWNLSIHDSFSPDLAFSLVIV